MEKITITRHSNNQEYDIYFDKKNTVSKFMEEIARILDLIPDTFVLTNDDGFLNKEIILDQINCDNIVLHMLCHSQSLNFLYTGINTKIL